MSTAAKFSVLPASPPNARIEPGDILDINELAGRLKVSPDWIYKQVEKGVFPVLRCGRSLRFVWPDVCEWLRKEKT